MPDFCIFCEIRDGNIPSDKLHADEHCFAIRDINPAAPVHLLIIPNRCFAQLAELDGEPHILFANMFAAARTLAESEGVAENGYRLVVNQGSDGGQEVMHFHMHLIGGRQMRALG